MHSESISCTPSHPGGASFGSISDVARSAPGAARGGGAGAALSAIGGGARGAGRMIGSGYWLERGVGERQMSCIADALDVRLFPVELVARGA